MNVRRGLLRAWVVISALWLSTVCILDSDRLSEIFVAVEPALGKGAVTLPPGPYACWVTRNPDNPFAMSGPGEPKSLMDAWRRCIIYKMQITGIALLPPFVLLALGYVVGWIAKGFQNT